MDPDSIRSMDPYPDPDSESGTRRAKMTHKKNLRLPCFEVLDVFF
jgi:hypothetical protein